MIIPILVGFAFLVFGFVVVVDWEKKKSKGYTKGNAAVVIIKYSTWIVPFSIGFLLVVWWKNSQHRGRVLEH
jgi:hypothetical protein